jgi:hypothetical protein
LVGELDDVVSRRPPLQKTFSEEGESVLHDDAGNATLTTRVEEIFVESVDELLAHRRVEGGGGRAY